MKENTDNKEIAKNLQELIDTLIKCKKDNKDCKKCKLRHGECLKFMRDTIAVALQFTIAGLNDKPEKYNGYDMFT